MDIVAMYAFEVFCVVAGVNLFYGLLLFSRLAFFKRKLYLLDKPPHVSVIICARNEAENLQEFLKLILIQQYPAEFEVIVVDDRSTDNTVAVVQEYQKRNPNLRLFSIGHNAPENPAGKKLAVKIGVENATNDTLVFTDADCKPMSYTWLHTLVSGYMSETRIVLGYSPVMKRDGLLNMLVRYDNVWVAIRYLSYAIAGLPYMGVGRNLSYKKSIVAEFSGYGKAAVIKTGDDDLFVNALATADNTEIVLHKDAFIHTKPVGSYTDFVKQKVRHSRSGYHYKFSHQLLLGVSLFTEFLLLPAFIVALLMRHELWIYTTTLFLAVCGVRWFLFIRSASKLNQTILGLLMPILSPLHLLNLLIIFLLSLFNRKDEWK